VTLAPREDANLAHELTHAGLFDTPYLGRLFAPDVVTTFAGDAVDGALPGPGHTSMDGYWRSVSRKCGRGWAPFELGGQQLHPDEVRHVAGRIREGDGVVQRVGIGRQ